MAKKAVGIRRAANAVANAQPRPGNLRGGRSGPRHSGSAGSIDWFATLLQGRPQRSADLLRQPRSQRASELWLVVIDASASTRRNNVLSRAKGLLSGLFDQAYQQRARLALLSVGGQRPEWLGIGFKAQRAWHDWLATLGAGGGTPLLAAIEQAREWLRIRQQRWPAEQQRVVLLTDGRVRDWSAIAPWAWPSVLVDIENGPIRLGRAKRLAGELGAEYCHIDNLTS